MKNQNILIALAVLFVIAVISFTFLAPLIPDFLSSENPEQEVPVEVPMPQLTDQEREKLGPKNELAELDCLPSDGMYGMIARPKRLLESPLLAEGQDLLMPDLIRFTMVPLDMTKIELLLSATSVRQVSVPAQPGQPAMPQVMPIPFACYYLQMTEPVDKQAILNQFVPPNSGPQPPKMRMVAGKEVYDLPTGFPLTTHALVFLNEKALLYVMGNEEMLKDVLDGKAPTGPLADRMARVKIDDCDVVFVGSAETGLPNLPPELIGNFSMAYGLSETLVKLLVENFRAIQLTLDLSAPENTPLLTLKFETLKPEGAKEIAKNINEQVVFFRSSLSLLQSKDSEPTPEGNGQKLGNQILDSVEISSQDSVVSATLQHFPTLTTYVSEYFQNRRQQIADLAVQEQQQMIFGNIFQRINTIHRYMIMHHDEKGQFPSAAICDAEGKPLLSWRVALLPYMGEKALYAQFKLDEPWDGPTNRPLIGKMPAIFGDVRAYDPTRTTIRLFNSEGTPFGKPVLKMSDLSSPQTTAMLVVVSPENAVEWTKPDTLAPCESLEDYVQLFGPMMPILLFDRNNVIMQFSSAAEQDRPLLLERLKNMIEGKPIQ